VSGTTSESSSGERSVLAPATALGVAERVECAGESWYLELLWPINVKRECGVGDTRGLVLFLWIRIDAGLWTLEQVCGRTRTL